jgi:hypothetical protein
VSLSSLDTFIKDKQKERVSFNGCLTLSFSV